LSGPETLDILKTLTGKNDFSAHVQKKVLINDARKNLIDSAMAVFHPSPFSYTGEDVAEISCHGNPLIVRSIIDAIHATGMAVPAGGGEFTQRAYKNGKMDLVQAEAVGALIQSKSFSGIGMANNLLFSGLSETVAGIRQEVEGLIAYIEGIFILEELDLDLMYILEKTLEIKDKFKQYNELSDFSNQMASGIKTVISGLPNAGKSSLFNAILGYDRSIVHEEEGTTRDLIREHLEYDGLDFIFHDTAGLRNIESGPEAMGVEKARNAIESADLVLYVIDASKGVTKDDKIWMASGKRTIPILNKIDLCSIRPEISVDTTFIRVSAKYMDGIGSLLKEMRSQFPEGIPELFIERHIKLFKKGEADLALFENSLKNGVAPDVAIIDLKSVLLSMKMLVGEELSEDILNDIFSRFCVGK
jgi:tRNA modification GTPase